MLCPQLLINLLGFYAKPSAISYKLDFYWKVLHDYSLYRSTSNRYNIHLTLTWLGFLGVCFELWLWQRRWGKDCEKTWYLAHAYRQIYFHNLCFAVLKSPKIYWYTFFWPTHYLLTWVLFYVKVVLFSKYIMKLGLCKSFLIQFTIFHFLKL